ncbi:MAG: tetraacyldisaccharide 4'-kinase, partial [Hyphomicrobiaceae bacterium]
APVILTRGFGGRRAGPCWIADGTYLAEDVGDEPLLLARAAPTLVARDRRAGARAIERSTERNPSVILMDDGLQNPSLSKDLTIAVVDAARGFGNGLVIPSGPLRAPLDLQMRLTGAILINTPPSMVLDDPEARSPLAAKLRHAFPGPVLEARAEATAAIAVAAGEPIVAFAGIANPERFYALLERQGGAIIARRSFADHHAFSETDAEALLRLADTHGAELITTEKDHVRLVGFGGARERLARRARQLAIKLSFLNQDELRLAELVLGAIRARRAGGA